MPRRHFLPFLGIILLLVSSSTAHFVVPEEFASLLGVIFSTIPQIRKGTDSRVGFGYRLGEHADFQVLLELGPQKFTKPIGEGDQMTNTNSKRNVDPEDYNRVIKPTKTTSNWLMNWSQSAKKEQQLQHQEKPHDPELHPITSVLMGNPNIPMKPLIPETHLKQLLKLYGKKSEDRDEEPQAQSSDDSLGTLPGDTQDSTVQFQDRHRVFVKTPAEKPSFANLERKRKITEDLMDVELD
ncbi:uncharacterized protein LOC129789946 [Lutzomyia longipalpis]|uniref:uncharacterized protein LOC129789946 n=1 Tax=Lutzomyia longipalpis TaxID=7200 RepID=UPI002483D8C5|nr:uncharacterized protein LOC129789946 [Lutzomyia longipalpis]